jgi:hypothetical protein
MTPSTPLPDLATQWKTARRLYPIYFELAREFAIDVKPCADLEVGAETPGKEAVEQANRWLEELDQLIQVHQLRQFLQTSSVINPEGLVSMVQHFLSKPAKTDVVRDKVDFLLVQYFSQLAPSGVSDADVDLAYVADVLEAILGPVERKAPVWLNALDRVVESSRRCRSLDELLHGGILEQGRKAKGQAGDLFYLPVALAAFTRFGYLMRRVFFRLMLGDLNVILDGLIELEEKGVETIDCRRAQFSAQEPIVRLRMICQSWKVLFQAEYSSGQPLRMLVDLRASVEHALGRGKVSEADAKAEAKPKAGTAVKPALASKAAASVGASTAASKPVARPDVTSNVTSNATPNAMKTAVVPPKARLAGKAAVNNSEPAEFEVSSGQGWDPESAQPGKPSSKA